MKIIHTSDWHLGKTLHGRRCSAEFEAFLSWMITEIDKQQADCLLIAGDIFDTSTPSNSVQALYYSFLHRASMTCCRHIVIIGGNHDSPSLLNAPRQLLKHLNVTVVGDISDDLEDEVITLCDKDGRPEMIVCGVPFLRDRDVRKAQAGESIDDKAKNLIAGIRSHYTRVGKIAQERREEIDRDIPIVAMGHLFAAGGKIAENNEVRDLYVGSLAHVHISIFPGCIDYLALGHLHLAQQIQQSETMRYSGSPLPLSFGKGNQSKSITTVDFMGRVPQISIIPVPQFLRLETIKGDNQEIMDSLNTLLSTSQTTLLEVIYTGKQIGNLQNDLQEKIEGSNIELLRTVNRQIAEKSLHQNSRHETLEDLDELDVFRRCLDAHNIDADHRRGLEFCFSEILTTLSDSEDEGQKQ